MIALHPTLRNLVTDERGNVLMTFGLTTFLAVAAVGGAVDFGRAYKEKARMQAALDAAVVGGMTTYRETEDWQKAKDRASALFSAQFTNAVQGGANGANAGRDTPVLNVNQAGNALTASASMQASTPFLKFVIGSDLNVGAASSADLSGETLTTTTRKKIEVGMMVDLTGSMGETRNGMTKIAALKLAGADLLNILLPSSGANDPHVRIGIAPFADYVNAGEYASAVTGLAATGGAYSNITNLSWTRNGPFTGQYTGATGNASGSQAGATPPTSGASAGGSGSTAGNGATYSNGYCSNPTTTQTQTTTNTFTSNTFGTANIGAPVNYGSSGSVNAAYYYQSGGGTWYYISNRGTVRVNGQNRPFGWKYYRHWNGNWYRADDNSYYNSHIPNTTTQTVTSVVAGCESQTQTQATSKLISCVTERTNTTHRYTDAAPNGTNGYVGAYSAGSSTKANYSSDGKCWVAGREMPAVIPLTNSRTNLLSFFNNATIGGATPGHLGTSWARYLVSPSWSSVWPTASAPVAYNDTGTIKAVILMTDGEYNIYHSGEASAVQARAHCDAMKADGVQIYSIGFGFSTSSAAGDGSREGNAKQLLAYCATSPAHLFVPYDGAALREAFTNIGTALSTQSTTSQVIQKAARVKN